MKFRRKILRRKAEPKTIPISELATRSEAEIAASVAKLLMSVEGQPGWSGDMNTLISETVALMQGRLEDGKWGGKPKKRPGKRPTSDGKTGDTRGSKPPNRERRSRRNKSIQPGFFGYPLKPAPTLKHKKKTLFGKYPAEWLEVE